MESSPSSSSSSSSDVDPHKFLENVLSDDALTWVKKQNADCIEALGDPTKTDEYKRILSILDSKDKIPSIAQIGNDPNNNGMYYNFWQDENHVQGIWRKTTLNSYRTSNPDWHTVLDLDALPKPNTHDTASTWVWHGSTLLDEGPQGKKWDRALISLSPGGSDADITREMDLITEEFIDVEDGGFEMLKAAKTSISYRSRDEVLVGTDFEGTGSTLTDSGYPRIIKSWKRGTPLSDATTIFEAQQTDIAGHQFAYHDRYNTCHEFRMRFITFYTQQYEYRCLTSDQLVTNSADVESVPFELVPIPDDADITTFGSQALITLRTSWKPPGVSEEVTTYEAGSLLAVPMKQVMNNSWSNVTILFQPTPTKSLQSTTTTKDYVVLSILDNVRTKLFIWNYNNNDDDEGEWSPLSISEEEDDAVPIGEDISVSNVNRDSSMDNSIFLTRDGYLQPDTLELIPDVGKSLQGREQLKCKPSMFDTQNLSVQQYFCISKDKTQIPYFVIGNQDMVYNGLNPTLLDAYGGFEISMLPSYSATVGAAWLEKGGVKVIANIRGGGEYGPKWHQAALKSNRYKCYEDMEAVAQDLISRNITNPTKLACIGGSNGGLMVGNLITRPIASKLFGAAVCQVPLLDMRIYSHLLAGASWMAEYGNPDILEEWTYLRQHSPYHLLRHDNLGLPEEKENIPAAAEDDDNKQQQQQCSTTPAVKNPDWKCPKILFTTSTRDDRVHPGHARKMVRSLLTEAKPAGKADTVYYWENIEGGHGGAADNKQRAHMWTLTYSFLTQMLGL